MKEFDFPYSGYNIGWRFEHPNYFSYPLEKLKSREKEKLFEDLRIILTTTISYQLLIPEKIDGIKIEYSSIEDLITQIETIKTKQNDFYIDRIEGYGIVNLPSGEKVKQRNLLVLDDLRLREKIYHICTYKSIWIPISIDESYDFKWQPELADLNSERLTDCLTEIYEKLSLPVEPSIGEIEKESPIWIKNFKLFVNPEILEREIKEIDYRNIDLQKYKITEA